MKTKTPITLLCGYLGAGKTTLLNQVLNNQKGYKVAVIVNDIGEVNIDASLIEKDANITDTRDIVPLTNGCICCTLKSQMSADIEKLISSGKYDYILIEASGVCEPMPIAQELELVKNGKLDNVVGVVDALRLKEEFAYGEDLLKKDSIEEEDIESLLIQQIEFCSTLVINKTDLVSEDDLNKVRKVINALHPGVKIIETEHGKVDVKDIISTGLFDYDKVYFEAGWSRALEGEDEEEHKHEHKHEGESEDEYGIGTFVYSRRKPFNRKKLKELTLKWPKNIIRCKGLVWFSDETSMAYLFETSGSQLLCGPYGRWLATASPAQIKKALKENEQLQKDWDEKVGDRMIRLCFIGKDINKDFISDIFDTCLDNM